MAINIDKAPVMAEGVWFGFDEDVSFKIRYLSPEDARRLRKKHVKKRFKHGSETEKIDEDAYNNSLTDYMIADWKGVELETGKPAACDLINKKKLVDISSEAALAILHFSQELGNYRVKEEALAEKN